MTQINKTLNKVAMITNTALAVIVFVVVMYVLTMAHTWAFLDNRGAYAVGFGGGAMLTWILCNIANILLLVEKFVKTFIATMKA